MSKATKRTLSLILCLAMAAAMFCAPAFAVGEEDVHNGHDCAEHEVVADSVDSALEEQMLLDNGNVDVAAMAAHLHSWYVFTETTDDGSAHCAANSACTITYGRYINTSVCLTCGAIGSVLTTYWGKHSHC